MVTQDTLRMREEKYYFEFATVVDLNKCLKEIKFHDRNYFWVTI